MGTQVFRRDPLTVLNERPYVFPRIVEYSVGRLRAMLGSEGAFPQTSVATALIYSDTACIPEKGCALTTQTFLLFSLSAAIMERTANEYLIFLNMHRFNVS